MWREPAGLAYALSAIVLGCIAVISWRRRLDNPPTAVSLAVVMAGACWWSLGLAISGSVPNETVASIAVLVTFPGPSTLTAAFVCLGLATALPQWRPRRGLLLALFFEPALIALAAVTNPWHRLIYAGPGTAELASPEKWIFGPLCWADTWYNYAGIAVGVALIGWAWWTAPAAFRAQCLALLFAAVFPTITNVVFIAGGFGDILDPTPASLAVTGTIMAGAIFRRDVFAFAPVARTLIIDQIGDAIVAISPTGRILDLNPAAVGLLRGLNPDAAGELVGRSAQELFGSALTPTGPREDVVVELPGGRAEFHVRASPLIDKRQRSLGTVLVARDVTEVNEQTRRLSAANAQLVLQVRTIERLRGDLVELASRDALTGLHNRRYLVERFGQVLADADATARGLAVVLVDVDRFKSINDEYGHLAGDQVLVAIAQRMREQAPAGALVARWGGEEFFIVLPGADAESGMAFAEELRHRAERHRVTVAGRTIQSTLSVGVAVYPGSGATLNELLGSADVALYEAKRSGRNVVLLHQPRTGLDATAAVAS